MNQHERGRLREPRFRADCTEFFHEQEDELLSFLAPEAVITALKAATVQSGRTFNVQICDVLSSCLGHKQPTLDDPRSVSDWGAMMAQYKFTLEENHKGPTWTIACEKRPEISDSV